jgi:hypothetical protein
MQMIRELLDASRGRSGVCLLFTNGGRKLGDFIMPEA